MSEKKKRQLERVLQVEELPLTCSTCDYTVKVGKATVITAGMDPNSGCDYNYWICPHCMILRKNMISPHIPESCYGAFRGIMSENNLATAVS